LVFSGRSGGAGVLGCTRMKIGVAQTAPVLLKKDATLLKVIQYIKEAGSQNVELLTFGEAFVPGYPVWLDRAGGSAFDDPLQKEIHAQYIENAVDVKGGDLEDVCSAAKSFSCALVLGVIERDRERGHSLFCSRVLYPSRAPSSQFIESSCQRMKRGWHGALVMDTVLLCIPSVPSLWVL